MYDWLECNMFDDILEECEVIYEKIWKDGGFCFWVVIYKDNLFDVEVNKELYKFWVKKIRVCIGDFKIWDLLVLLEMLYYFGIK